MSDQGIPCPKKRRGWQPECSRISLLCPCASRILLGLEFQIRSNSRRAALISSCNMHQLFQEHAKLLRRRFQMREKAHHQILERYALRVRADVERGNHFSCWISNRYGHGAQPVFQFLIDDGVTVALHHPQDLSKLVRGGHGALGEARKLDACEQLFEFFRRQVGEQDSSHGSTKCRQAAPDTKIDRHDARSEEHTSELQSPCNLVCRLLLEKTKQ